MILEFELWFVGPKPTGFPAFFPALQSQICFSKFKTKPYDNMSLDMVAVHLLNLLRVERLLKL